MCTHTRGTLVGDEHEAGQRMSAGSRRYAVLGLGGESQVVVG